jgi:serine phosphatase RsbU (regulator of sigma subunit)
LYKTCVLLAIFICTIINSLASEKQAEVTTLRGIYKGENIFLSDPFAPNGVGFCTDSIYLNKRLFKEVNISTTVEINLSLANLILGDSILIDIYHKPQCKPTHINQESISIESSYEFMRCLITGKVLNSNGNLIESSNTIIFNSKRELEEFTTTNSNDGGYTLALKFDKVYEVVYAADGYQTKRVVMDLRNIPTEHKKSWELVANIRLDSITEIYNDSLLYELAIDKMAYNPTTKKMEWDADYRKAMERAFAYIHESAQKSEQLLIAEIEKQAEINTSKNQRLIIYSAIILIILILFFLIYVIKVSKQRKKDNEIIFQQNIRIEQQIKVVVEAHKEITDSINYAERIQRSFLATTELLNENLNEYFVYFNPKEAVSGDFYWAGKLENGNFALVNADSTGHGVPGAIMSILNISSIEKAVDQNLNKPADIFNQTRTTIIERLKNDGSREGGKDGMDASLIAFNSDKTKMFYVAAQNPIWIIRDGNLTEIKPEKMPVGRHHNDKVDFVGGEYDILKGDQIYTLTDGFQDQFGGQKGKKFMIKKMREYVLSISHLTMNEQHQKISDTFSNWKGELEQIDDVCVIGVRV